MLHFETCLQFETKKVIGIVQSYGDREGERGRKFNKMDTQWEYRGDVVVVVAVQTGLSGAVQISKLAANPKCMQMWTSNIRDSNRHNAADFSRFYIVHSFTQFI